ncbi:type I restriction-modification system subunit M [Holdemania filiformis]|uniref:type I restriction-modification system subunit M n=1 Tax=Holdemania filiformis TaxID=61171 RepID=UPI00242C4503|nr:class I SAM-dependent DNA methyltransferase [Holdemania filiformis]
MSLSTNVSEKAALIWAIADKLTGVYKPHEYGEVILPLTVIRRFDCILSDTKEAVLEKYESVKNLPMKDVLLRSATGGKAFYNTSKYTFEKLLDDPDNIEANFRDYLNGFSENVQDIIEKFKFDGHITTMANKGILYIVIKEFTSPKANLHPDVISNLEMGYIFEEIIRRFSEAHNEDAGQHYTPREVIRLMVNILFHDDNDILSGNNVAKTIYDPACGTGGMLSVAEEYLHELNAATELLAFGQELNDQTFAICKADMLIKGNDANFIKDGNTLSDDQFEGQKFDYIISNPPFGREWKNEKAKVEAEAKRGFAGRFGAGLPAASDGQMLFLLTAISKMKEPKDGGSRIAIIHNGSPLFAGDAGSGPSEIRKYILENDLLEAIIALPNDIFYNTGIATYIWVLSNKKSGTKREGRVQLINANGLFEKRRKALGNKRNDIPEESINEITKVYGDFKETEISKIFDNEDFGYTKITVEQPLLDEACNPVLKKGKPQADTALRDTENVPLKEDIEEYFKREVLPFAPNAWIDEKKSKIGYEIPFTRYFYKYEAPRPSSEIMAEIMELELELSGSLEEVFDL